MPLEREYVRAMVERARSRNSRSEADGVRTRKKETMAGGREKGREVAREDTETEGREEKPEETEQTEGRGCERSRGGVTS